MFSGNLITVGIRLADAQNMEIQCTLFTIFKFSGYQGLFSESNITLHIATLREMMMIIIRWEKMTKRMRMRIKRKITMRVMRIMSREKHSEAATH